MSIEENFLDFICPGCSQTVSFPGSRAGFLEECPFCRMPFIVPSANNTAAHTLPFPLSTPRLLLRRLETEDHGDLVQVFVNDQSVLSEAEKAEIQGEEDSRVASWLEADSAALITSQNENFYLAIVLVEEKKVIGYLCLRFADATRLQAEISAHVNAPYRRKGLASEAVAALLDFCFTEISLHRMTAQCDASNIGALRMLEKVAIRKEGVFLEDRWDGKQWINTAYHALLSHEYNASLPENQR